MHIIMYTSKRDNIEQLHNIRQTTHQVITSVSFPTDPRRGVISLLAARAFAVSLYPVH